VEFAKDLRAHGKSLVDATMEACHLRFRPILMTGVAFICGVLPMAISTGAGGLSQQALGTGVAGGMLAVVVLALLFVPVFFVAVQRLFSPDKPTPGEETKTADDADVAGKPAPSH
jgi:multidrug efflux pump